MTKHTNIILSDHVFIPPFTEELYILGDDGKRPDIKKEVFSFFGITGDEYKPELPSEYEDNHNHLNGMLINGQRGMGKTWMCLYYHRSIFSKMDPNILTSLFISVYYVEEKQTDFANEFYLDEKGNDNPTNSDINPDEMQKKLDIWTSMVLRFIAKKLTGNELQEGIDLWKLREIIENKIRNAGGQKFVIFLDSILEHNNALQTRLEEYLLEPLTNCDNVFFILTGRGSNTPWKRRVVERYRKVDLPGIEEKEYDNLLTKQLALDVPENPFKKHVQDLKLSFKKYQHLAQTNPLGVLLLAQMDYVNDGIKAVINKIIPHYYRMDEFYGESCKALCVLDRFKDEEIVEVCLKYADMKAANRDNSYSASLRHTGGTKRDTAFRIRQGLIDMDMVSTTAGGSYCLDSLIKRACIFYLTKFEPDIWLELNQAVADLYRKWAGEHSSMHAYYSEMAKDFEKRAGKTAPAAVHLSSG